MIKINNDDEALQNNIKWARAAVTYARMAVPNLGNKGEDIVRTLGGSWLGVQIERFKFKHDGKKYPTMLDACRATAEYAKTAGVGNCGEVSAIAFIYLHDSQVRPLDWISVQNGDHNFVLIGRDMQNTAIQSTWGKRCALCDPWNKLSGSAVDVSPTELSCSKGGVQSFKSDLRVDGRMN